MPLTPPSTPGEKRNTQMAKGVARLIEARERRLAHLDGLRAHVRHELIALRSLQGSTKLRMAKASNPVTPE